MCCQESGEREATVQLFCPKASADQPKYRKVNENQAGLIRNMIQAVGNTYDKETKYTDF